METWNVLGPCDVHEEKAGSSFADGGGVRRGEKERCQSNGYGWWRPRWLGTVKEDGIAVGVAYRQYWRLYQVVLRQSQV